jgi:26S proteasome regulatory subunit T5
MESVGESQGEVERDPSIWPEQQVEEEIDPEIMSGSVEYIERMTRMIEGEFRVLASELSHMTHEEKTMKEKLKENQGKVKLNRQLPHLVGHVVEVLDSFEGDARDEDGSLVDLDEISGGKGVVIKTTTRQVRDIHLLLFFTHNCPLLCVLLIFSLFAGHDVQTIFLPVAGLVDPKDLSPGDLVGVNKDSYLILDKHPPEYDSRVKAMEVDERPTESYADIGGLDDQIQELREAVVLPMTHADKFKAIGIHPPKGVLLYGVPGTGKTLLARACAAQTNATFLKLAGPQLVQVCDTRSIPLVSPSRANTSTHTCISLFLRLNMKPYVWVVCKDVHRRWCEVDSGCICTCSCQSACNHFHR